MSAEKRIAETSERVRFWGWLVILIAAVAGAHFLAGKAGAAGMDLHDTLLAMGLGYWVGWTSRD